MTEPRDRAPRTEDLTDDTSAHGFRMGADAASVDDTEGHAIRSGRLADDDDAEGHGIRGSV